MVQFAVAGKKSTFFFAILNDFCGILGVCLAPGAPAAVKQDTIANTPKKSSEAFWGVPGCSHSQPYWGRGGASRSGRGSVH